MQKKSIIILSAVIAVLLIAGVFAYTQWQKAEQKLAAMQAPDSQDAQQQASEISCSGRTGIGNTASNLWTAGAGACQLKSIIPEGDSTPPPPLTFRIRNW